MSQNEVTAIMKAKFQANKDSWEQTRILSFYTVVAQVGTKQYKKPQDLFPLNWDEGYEKKHASRLTKDGFFKAAKQII